MSDNTISRFTSRIIRWLRQFLAWCLHPRLAIFTTLVIVVTLWIPFFVLQTELSVRISGLVLQWLGLATAAIGIRDTRRLFGRPTFLESVRTWFSRFPRLRPKTVTLEAEAGHVKVSMEATENHWKGAGTNPTTESRLSAIESNLLSLKERLEQLEGSHKQLTGTLHEKLEKEQAARITEDRKLHATIESASADGLHLAMVGVVWLAVGIALATLPAESLYAVRLIESLV